MNRRNYESLADKFKVLGHPERTAIFDLLCNCGCQSLRVKEIYESLKLDQPTVSRHLNLMKRCGLLIKSIDQGKITYHISKKDKSANCIMNCFNQKI